MQIEFLTIAELNRAYDQRELSPVEVTRALLDRIAKHDGKLDSFIRVTEDVALAEAKAAETELMAGNRRGPMHGIPYGLKDIVETAGIPTTGHSKLRQHHVPQGRRRDRPPPQSRRRHPDGQARHLGIRARRAELRPALAAGAQPVGPRAPARRLVERPRRGARGRVPAGGDRHRHRRLDPRPRRVLRHRRTEADLWQGQPPRRLPQHLHDGPYRPDDPQRRGHRPDAAGHRRLRPGRSGQRGCAGAGLPRGARRQGVKGLRLGLVEGWHEGAGAHPDLGRGDRRGGRGAANALAPRSSRSNCRACATTPTARRRSRASSSTRSTSRICAPGRRISAASCATGYCPAR